MSPSVTKIIADSFVPLLYTSPGVLAMTSNELMELLLLSQFYI